MIFIVVIGITQYTTRIHTKCEETEDDEVEEEKKTYKMYCVRLYTRTFVYSNDCGESN